MASKILRDRWRLIRKLNKARTYRRAQRYLEKKDVMRILIPGQKSEIAPDMFDMYHLHRIVRERRPKHVLEFGVGFSTLVIADALHRNYQEDQESATDGTPPVPGKVWTLDASAKWIANVKQKLPRYLKMYADIRQSDAEICLVDNEICCMYKNLPNIIPDFVYLDAPSSEDIKGKINGLDFSLEIEGVRKAISADILFYESSLRSGFFLLIDGRYTNMHFLQRHLKRNYKVHLNRALKFSTFELMEHTGRS